MNIKKRQKGLKPALFLLGEYFDFFKNEKIIKKSNPRKNEVQKIDIYILILNSTETKIESNIFHLLSRNKYLTTQ